MSVDETIRECDWTINEDTAWPPKGRPSVPYGPTEVEILRSCALRMVFERSRGYPRRTSFDGRIGTAFHKVLQSLRLQPIAGTTEEIAEETRKRFDQQMKIQESQADRRPREKGLPRDRSRIDRAVEALVVAAQQMSGTHSSPTVWYATIRPSTDGLEPEAELSGHAGEVEVEVPVATQDGLFKGRVDRVEPVSGGVRIVDYKSALRDDLPERYERQVQMYALMWHETRGEWPAEAEVVYPLTGTSYQVPVDPHVCQQVADESTALVKWVEEERSVYELGKPGDVCKVCEFRPWCKPFWDWQAREKSPVEALSRAYLGFEGGITSIEEKSHYWKLIVSWRNAQVTIAVPIERFPQLSQAKAGTRVRVLEMQLKGMRHEPRAVVSEWSEIYLLQIP